MVRMGRIGTRVYLVPGGATDRRTAGAITALIVLALAFAPTLIASAASSARGTGLPDGNRARDVYTVDGGYGLGEAHYAELVANLLER